MIIKCSAFSQEWQKWKILVNQGIPNHLQVFLQTENECLIFKMSNSNKAHELSEDRKSRTFRNDGLRKWDGASVRL